MTVDNFTKKYKIGSKVEMLGTVATVVGFDDVLQLVYVEKGNGVEPMALDIFFENLEMELPWATPGRKPEETVDHPSHYNRDGAMECIEEMEVIYGTKAVITFCILNAHKYRYRAADKNGEEDLKKSDWYIRKAKELYAKIDYSEEWSGTVKI